MTNMKVSIVIPAYNEEQSLPQTLRAALAQDYPDFEVIVVDNASTDKTSDVARSFGVKAVKEGNKGLLHARERGRLEATGDVIANIDADCLPDPTWLSRGVALFAHEGIAAVTGPYDYYDAPKGFRNFSLKSQQYVYHAVNSMLQMRMVKRGAVLIGGNNFIRASVLERMGGYDTDIIFYGEDTDTAKRVSRFGKVTFNPGLTMKTSARRFKDEGTLKLTIKYLFHFFRVVFSR